MSSATAPYPEMTAMADDQSFAPEAPLESATPDQALQALGEHHGPVLVDLDETLFLRNSTELYLDSAWPGVAALMLLRLLDLLKPWRLTGGEATRDHWRAGLITLLMPWTIWLWRRRVRALAASHANAPLREALMRRPAAPVVVTIGFGAIVGPLCRALGLGDTRVVACRLFHPADRRDGKLDLATRVLGERTVGRALLITDSPEDHPLLRACERGLLVRWPDALFTPALAGVYVPGQYISRVKHVGQRYILRGILQEDFAFWVLASIGLATAPFWHVAGLGLLLLSFWAIYEQGYADNDRCGARYEAAPKLSPEFHKAPVATPALAPWIWAAAAGALGICALARPGLAQPQHFLIWAAVLIATDQWFRLYNRMDKGSRVWLYSGLQIGRTAAFATLVPVMPVGAAALAAHVFARWMPYFYYRHGGTRWLSEQLHLTRLVLFIWLIVFLAMAAGPESVFNWSCALLLAWNLFRARQELRLAWRNAHRIDRP